MALAKPKSQIFTTPLFEMSIFSGLTSLCITCTGQKSKGIRN